MTCVAGGGVCGSWRGSMEARRDMEEGHMPSRRVAAAQREVSGLVGRGGRHTAKVGWLSGLAEQQEALCRQAWGAGSAGRWREAERRVGGEDSASCRVRKKAQTTYKVVDQCKPEDM